MNWRFWERPQPSDAARAPDALRQEALGGIAAGEPLERILAKVAELAALGGAAASVRLANSDQPVASFGCFPPEQAAARAFPLRNAAGERLGTLTIAHPQDEKLAESAAQLAVVAIEQQHLLRDLQFYSQHDSLTLLSNRLSMENNLSRLVGRHAASAVGLLYIDLDRFGRLNEIFSHNVADQILRVAASRLRQATGPEHVLSRAAGDEFVILAPHLPGPSSLLQLADEVRRALEEPFSIDGNDLRLTASIGAAFGGAGADAGELQRQALIAMVEAKRRGGNSIELYRPELTSTSPERLALESALRQALRNGQLRLDLQAKVLLSTGQLHGAECLLRWQTPDLGIVSPAVFIPLAEEIGLIETFGAWSLRRACQLSREWHTLGLAPGRLAVNVSPIQFAQPGFARKALDILKEEATSPEAIEIEVTESTIMRDLQHAIGEMNALREAGIPLSLDDFGTGHSSLAYLRDLPVSIVKIDRSFVRDIQDAAERPAFVQGILDMARSLHLTVVAEGIETTAQHEALRAMGCDLGQGYLYAKPCDLETLARLPLPARPAPQPAP